MFVRRWNISLYLRNQLRFALGTSYIKKKFDQNSKNFENIFSLSRIVRILFEIWNLDRIKFIWNFNNSRKWLMISYYLFTSSRAILWERINCEIIKWSVRGDIVFLILIIRWFFRARRKRKKDRRVSHPRFKRSIAAHVFLQTCPFAA